MQESAKGTLYPRWQLHYLFKDQGAFPGEGRWHEDIEGIGRMTPKEACERAFAMLQCLAREREEEKLSFACLWSVEGDAEYDTEGPKYIFSVPDRPRHALLDVAKASELFLPHPQEPTPR